MQFQFNHRLKSGRLVTVIGDYTPGNSGNVSGPIESCYPPEPPEFEIEKILLAGRIKDYPVQVSDEEAEEIADEACRQAERESADSKAEHAIDWEDFNDRR